jgi:vacuolar-type H+-ATPase subunit H
MLGQLLDREQRMASLFDAARADAERVLVEARQYAAQAEAACESAIEDRTARLTLTCEQEFQAELQRIESEAAAEASRFADLDPARLRNFVALVLAEIVPGRVDGAPR